MVEQILQQTHISVQSAGVFDLNLLKHPGLATAADFCPLEFKERTKQWGEQISRYPYKYPIGHRIELVEPAKNLGNYVNHVPNSGENTSFREKIRIFVTEYPGYKHIFCMHTNHKYGYHYYTKTMIEYVRYHRSCNKQRFRMPLVLIITENEVNAKSTCTDLHKAKLKLRDPIGVKLLGRPDIREPTEGQSVPKSPEYEYRADIVVGTAREMSEYLEKARELNILERVQESVRFIAVENVEKLTRNEEFFHQTASTLVKFLTCHTRFMFFAYASGKCSVSKALMFCEEITRGDMFVELELLGYKELFEYIQVELIHSREDFWNELVLIKFQQSETDTSCDEFSTAGILMTPPMQKVHRCLQLIEKLASKRQSSNAERNQNRSEKILVVTSTAEVANYVTVQLKSLKRSLNISTLTRKDPIDQMEIINFEFRTETYNVIVVDFKSIHDINRGIVDAVIFHSLPEARFFQTLFEEEMERLIARDAVKLKVHVLFDETKDIKMLLKILALIRKYNQVCPQFMEKLVNIYNNQRQREREEGGSTSTVYQMTNEHSEDYQECE